MAFGPRIGTMVAVTAGFLAAIALPAAAQEKIAYPTDVVTLVTHSSPGGGSDVFLRDMARYLREIIDADFVVENVSGGSGANAMAHLAQSPTDGSVLYATTPTYIFTSLMSDLSATYQDLEPLVNVFYDPAVLYTRADAPFQTLGDVIEHAKTNRSAWGAANPGSLERISLEEMKRKTGVDAAIVTSEGGGETMINILNGTLDIAVGEVQELRSQLDAKQIRILAVSTDNRLETLPDVPTLKESGIDMTIRKFRGLAGPKGLSDEAVAAWEEAIPRLLENPEYKAAYTKSNLVPTFIPHAEYVTFMETFATEQKTFLTEAGVIK